MPLIENKQKGLIVPISDDPVTGLKRKVRFEGLTYSHTGTGMYGYNPYNEGVDVTTQVVVNLTVFLFSKGAYEATGETDENGFPTTVFNSDAYGQVLTSGNYQPKPFSLIANDTTLVDIQGNVLAMTSDYEHAVRMFEQAPKYTETIGEDGIPVVTPTNYTLEDFLPEALKGVDFYPEGQHFRMIADNLSIPITPTIKNYIGTADTFKRFD